MRFVHPRQLRAAHDDDQGRTRGCGDRRHCRHGRGGRSSGGETVMFNREQMVAEIAKEVVARLQAHMNGAATTTEQPVPPTGADGIFETVDDAVKASTEAQKKVEALSLEDRGR